MKNVLIRIQEYKGTASETEKGIIAWITEHPQEASECSIQGLAQETFSSPATIIRFCHKMGFKGFKEFQKSLLYELAIRKETDRKRFEDIKEEDSLEEIVDKVTYKTISSLEDTRKLIDMQVLEKCVNLLIESSAVYLYGLGSSLLVARDAYLKWLRINKECFICDDVHAQYLQAMNMKKGSVAMIISYSGMTQEMITCAEIIRDKGLPIILISRLDDSPLTRLADYNLCVASTEVLIRHGAMSSRISQLNMIDILYTAYIRHNFEENMQQLKRTHIRKQESPES